MLHLRSNEFVIGKYRFEIYSNTIYSAYLLMHELKYRNCNTRSWNKRASISALQKQEK